MADFLKAIDYVLANEGGYVDNSADPGGETNFGISKRAYPYLDIKNLTREEAVTIYQRDYWKFDGFATQRVATKVFDTCVNLGPTQAIRILQLALGTVQVGPVVADGKLGPQTIDAVNTADEDKLVDEFKARLAKFYCDEAVGDATGLDNSNRRGFVLGWLRRAVRG
jgi:lysozyme family protein